MESAVGLGFGSGEFTPTASKRLHCSQRNARNGAPGPMRSALLGGGFFLGPLAQGCHGGSGLVFAVLVSWAAFSLGGVVILSHGTSWCIGGWGRLPGFV